MLEAERAGRFGREGRGELRLVLLDRQQALHDRLPDPGELAIAQLRQLVRVAEHVAVAERAAHLAALHHWEHRLRGEDARQVGGEGRARGRHEPAGAGAGAESEAGDAAVPKQIGKAQSPVEQRGRIARDELAPWAQRPPWPEPAAAGADRQ